mmetsp:Transcript_1329/g.2706  ORF Transcript_1329/g.2706 Transcript_1329/m.2706 type:complete len:222 (-) Transcript_1329:485-1150(-)
MQQVLSFRFQKIGFHFHHHVVPRNQRGYGVEKFSRSHFIKRLNSEGDVGLVVAVLQGCGPGLSQTTSCSPFHNLSITDFSVPRMILQEVVQPIEGSFIWKCNGKQDLKLAILATARGCYYCIFLCCFLNGAALKWDWCNQARSEVHLQSHISEGNVRKQGVANKPFRKRLWLRHPSAVFEQADGVRIWAGWVQVQENPKNVVTDKPFCYVGLVLVVDEAAI